MEMLEKVERLREKANISYEEAKAILEQTNGDLLDAIVLLEQQGKAKTAGQGGTYSTSYEEQTEYVRVQDKVEEQKQSAPSLGRGIRRIIKSGMKFIMHTSFNLINIFINSI